MKVVDLLYKYRKLTKEIKDVNFHMNLLSVDLGDLKGKIPELKNKNEQEIAEYLVEIFDKCNMLSPNYNPQIDEEMTRIGLQTNVFNGEHNHNIWIHDFENDGFGFGQNAGDLYDDYIDSMSQGR